MDVIHIMNGIIARMSKIRNEGKEIKSSRIALRTFELSNF